MAASLEPETLLAVFKPLVAAPTAAVESPTAAFPVRRLRRPAGSVALTGDWLFAASL
jgi:hypothetical protein